MSKKWFIWLCAVLITAGCSHQAPQRPSQRKGETPQADSAALALMQLNKELAEAADKMLMQKALEQKEPYALYEGNIWVTILERGDIDSPTPKVDDEWVVHMRIFNLEEQLLKDIEGTYRIGKHELPLAVDVHIKEWHQGCRVRMYVPWYTAYGMQGTDKIPPYENVIIELELK